MVSTLIKVISNIFILVGSRFKNFIKVWKLIIKGVRLKKPSTVEIRGKLTFGKNVEIHENVIFEGEVCLSSGVKIV